jgi:hypothetical protein
LCSYSELPSVIWNPKVQYRIHKSSPLVPILIQINPTHISLSYSYISKIHFKYYLPTYILVFLLVSFLLAFSLIIYVFFLPIYATCPAHLIFLDSIMLGGSCQYNMARPQVEEIGDGLQLWRAAANVLNMQPRTASKGWSCSLEVGRGDENPSP